MARQIDEMVVTILYTRQQDGSYTATVQGVYAGCSDPVGSNPTDQARQPVVGIVMPGYSKSQSCDDLVKAAFDSVKAAAGIS